MIKIRKIDPFKWTLLSFFISILFYIFFLSIILINQRFFHLSNYILGHVHFGNFFYIVLQAIFFGIIGGTIGFVKVSLINLFLKYFGGIKIEIENDKF